MMSPRHFGFGILCHVACFPLPPDQFLTTACAACIADVDLKGSWAGQITGVFGSLVRVFAGGHRKLTHKWWAPLFVIAPSFLLSHGFAGSVALGYYSHLFADKIYDTDGWLEHAIGFALMPLILLGTIYRVVY